MHPRRQTCMFRVGHKSLSHGAGRPRGLKYHSPRALDDWPYRRRRYSPQHETHKVPESPAWDVHDCLWVHDHRDYVAPTTTLSTSSSPPTFSLHHCWIRMIVCTLTSGGWDCTCSTTGTWLCVVRLRIRIHTHRNRPRGIRQQRLRKRNGIPALEWDITLWV